ncbi:hypothetical protein EMCRGX_G030290 [Ephydatia muelleri]
MDGPSTPRNQRSNRQMPTPSSGVNPPSSSAGNPYVVPSDFRGRDAASNSNRSGGNSVTVTVRRRYCRTEASSKDDTYKGFKQWLSSMYLNGKPSPQEMEDIFKEEEELVSPSFHPPTQDEQPSVEDAMLSDAEGYNPEF